MVRLNLNDYGQKLFFVVWLQKKENMVSVNDYLTAKMFGEYQTDKVIIASDLRKQLHCYLQGSLGNYSTAFSVHLKKKSSDTMITVREVHEQVQKIMKTLASLYLILQCYAILAPSLIDATAISTLSDFDSKAGRFIGTAFFGFKNPSDYSITNLGKMESRSIDKCYVHSACITGNKENQGYSYSKWTNEYIH